MRALPRSLWAGLLILTTGIGLSPAHPEAVGSIRPVSDFSGIPNEKDRSIAFFTEAGKVIQHPRCVNCHPAGDRPQQGDDGHPHQPLVVRGAGGFGAVAMQCPTCHQAPIEMACAGKSLGEICTQIKDPARNGGKNLDEIVHHMADDSLVGWAWNPGADRTPAPGTQQQFGALIRAWAESGAACPAP